MLSSDLNTTGVLRIVLINL